MGDFRLVGLIGQGGMGQVWEAEQISLHRRVAVKFVRPERVTERQLELFAREARAGGRLSHPGIVTVHGHGQSEGLAWIAMEFVEGAWTLRDFLDEAARCDGLPEGYDRHVAHFVAEIADAMQAAHDAGVIHRDLKPQNILVTSEDRPKVTDFGLARITDETALSQTGDFAGTYFYMSPEQVMARRMGIDRRTDVFSLGVVLYELLTLRRPFEGDTSHQVAAQIVTKDPPDMRTIRSSVPRDLAVITGKALEKDRDKRFQSMKELAADLRRHLANEPILAKPPTPAERLVKWGRRNPARSVAAGIVVAALTVIGLLLVANMRTNRALAKKSEESETRRLAAEVSTRGQLARAAEVERLLVIDRSDALLDEAEGSWPASPEEDWLASCRVLLEELPARERELRELRAEAIEVDEREQQARRAQHPRLPELESLRSRLAFLEDQHAAVTSSIPDHVANPDAALDQITLPDDFDGAYQLAVEWVGEYRTTWGQERAGVALARKAVEVAADSMERFTALRALAWGLIEIGRIDEGLAASLQAGEEAQAAGLQIDSVRVCHAELLKRVREVADPLGGYYRRQRDDLETSISRLECEIEEDLVRLPEEESKRYGQVLRVVRSMQRLATQVAFIEAAPERDARRIADVEALRNALERYYDDHGSYPEPSRNSSWGGWDVSNDGDFIPALRDEGYVDEDGADPINDAHFQYRYASYSAGAYGCTGQADFCVVGVRSFETPGAQVPRESFTCSERDWGGEFAYVIGVGSQEAARGR